MSLGIYVIVLLLYYYVILLLGPVCPSSCLPACLLSRLPAVLAACPVLRLWRHEFRPSILVGATS